MADAGNDDGRQRRQSKPDEQWRDYRDGHAKAAHALQEGSEDPTEQQDAQARVVGQAAEPGGDAAECARFQHEQVEQQCRPDDVHNVDRENEGARMGVEEQRAAGAEMSDRQHQRQQPAGQPSARAAPTANDEQEQDEQGRRRREECIDEGDGHMDMMIMRA